MNDFDLIDELKKLVIRWETKDEFYDQTSSYDNAFGDGCEFAANDLKELIAKLGG